MGFAERGGFEMPSSEYYHRQADLCVRMALSACAYEERARLLERANDTATGRHKLTIYACSNGNAAKGPRDVESRLSQSTASAGETESAVPLAFLHPKRGYVDLAFAPISLARATALSGFLLPMDPRSV